MARDQSPVDQTDQLTFHMPRQCKEALRREAFENRRSYRDILVEMICQRYGLKVEANRPRRRK